MYRIAIVDDNEAWCCALQIALQQRGFRVSTFTDAHAFLRVAHQFDLAVVDFSMPTRPYKQELDGSQVITQLRKHLKNPPKLILASAFFSKDSPMVHEICPQADAHLSKSMSLAQILDFISALVERSDVSQTTSRHI